MATIQLKCKSCNGIMSIDEEREVLFCPYCGSKEIFAESDAIKRERIRAKAYKDVTLGSKEIDRQMRLEEIKAEERKRKSDNKSFIIGMVFLFLMMLFGLFLGLLSYILP